jgi:hypothetical protein
MMRSYPIERRLSVGPLVTFAGQLPKFHRGTARPVTQRFRRFRAAFVADASCVAVPERLLMALLVVHCVFRWNVITDSGGR